MLSRRALLLSTAVLAGCARRKATRYPGYCFVANQESRSLAVVDLSTFGVWHPIALPAAPTAVLADPHRPKVLALAGETGTVFEIDVASLSLGRRSRAGNQALSMRLSPEGDALWVLYREPAALVEFRLDSFTPRRRIALPAPPDDFDLWQQRAAITSVAARAVFIASIERATVEHAVPCGVEPGIVTFQQKGAQIVAGSPADRSLTMIDTASGRVLVRLPVLVQPRHFCNDAEGGQLFVTGEGKDAVIIVYPYQTEVGETVLAGRAPAGMAVVGRFLLVANPETNTVTALDSDSRKLAAVVQVGQEPRDILITPDNQYALVLNRKSGDLAVIRVAALDNSERVRRYKSAPLFTLIPVGEKPVSAAVVTLS